MDREVKESLIEAKLLKKLISALNRLDNDNVRLLADEQQTLAAARIRYATVTAYLHRQGETLS